MATKHGGSGPPSPRPDLPFRAACMLRGLGCSSLRDIDSDITQKARESDAHDGPHLLRALQTELRDDSNELPDQNWL
eukprot:7190671-Pyramimonas_sp.AAC.1